MRARLDARASGARGRACGLALALVATMSPGAAAAQHKPRLMLTAAPIAGARFFSGGEGGAGRRVAAVAGAQLRASLAWPSGHGVSLGASFLLDMGALGPGPLHSFRLLDASYRLALRAGGQGTRVGLLAGPALGFNQGTCGLFLCTAAAAAHVASLDRTSVGALLGGFIEHAGALFVVGVGIDYRLLVPLGVPEIGIEHLLVAHIDVGLASAR